VVEEDIKENLVEGYKIGTVDVIILEVIEDPDDPILDMYEVSVNHEHYMFNRTTQTMNLTEVSELI